MKKTIVITGVSKGLGRALTEKFISLNHTLIGCSRSCTQIESLQKQYPSHSFSVVDVADNKQVQGWVKSFNKIPDLVINNAAIINHPAPLWQIPPEDFSQLIDINIKGTANVIRYIVPMMIKQSSWGNR